MSARRVLRVSRTKGPVAGGVLAAVVLVVAACSPSAGDLSTPRASVPARAPSEEMSPLVFVDRSASLGIDVRHDRGAQGDLHLYEVMGGGVAWLDYDADGDPDLYLVSNGPAAAHSDAEHSKPPDGANHLFRNDGARFVDVTADAGVAGRGVGLGVAVGDIDNDGFPDLYVTCFGPNILYRNRGDGTFEELASAGVAGGSTFSGGAAFGDVDGDGFVDLYVAEYIEYDATRPPHCTARDRFRDVEIPIHCGPHSFRGLPDRLYRNLGDGRFLDVTESRGIAARRALESKSLGVACLDIDGDRDIDIYVACDTTPNLCFLNRGDGTFEEVGLEVGLGASALGSYEGSMGIAHADVDGDLALDLLVTNFAEEDQRLWFGRGKAGFVDGTMATGIAAGSHPLVGWGAAFVDLDEDGMEELVVANGHIYPNADAWLAGQTYREPVLIHRRMGERFAPGVELRVAGRVSLASHRGLAVADFDGDGDSDLAITALDERPLILENRSANRHWLGVRLVGGGPGGRDAIGARVEVTTATKTLVRWRAGGGSYLSAHQDVVRFGLGSDHRVHRLRVEWPGGGETVLADIDADRVIVVAREGALDPRAGETTVRVHQGF